jgi:excisionase family DNA binding protein
MQPTPQSPPRIAQLAPDDLLTPAAAATIAARSVRTIRRAYRRGSLPAYRDGAGRGVRIRYADLRGWMMSEPVAVDPPPGRGSPPGPAPAAARPRGGSLSENLALLRAAREARSRPGRRAAASSASA